MYKFDKYLQYFTIVDCNITKTMFYRLLEVLHREPSGELEWSCNKTFNFYFIYTQYNNMSCCKKTTDTKECCEPSSCNTYKQTASSCCDKSSCNSFDVKTEVQKRYGEVAVSDISKLEEAKLVANSFGYSREELASIPEAANMGLSCGNPLAIAGLKQGDVVVDLGSGGGLDCFLAASKVGPDGKVYDLFISLLIHLYRSLALI